VNREQKKLLRAVFAHVRANPDRFDMNTYVRVEECGTTACLAGWTLLLSGWEGGAWVGSLGRRYPQFTHPDRPEFILGGDRGISSEAARCLGIASDDAYVLFHMGTYPGDTPATIDELAAFATKITGVRGL
jgi:hypothetical protein